MRYLDQIYEVTVDVPDLDLPDDELRARWAENMHERFEQLYAYRQQEQDIRIVTLRAGAVGRLPVEGENAGAAHSQDASAPDLPSGDIGAVTTGPAVINTDYNTVVIGEGCSASFDGNGVLHIAVEDATQATGDAQADSVTLSVVGNRLESIAIEMMDVMLRTALSQILNASRDFSTAILDGQCRLVAQGEGIPVHVSALPVAGRAVLDYFGDSIAPGDVFLLNDPYFGGSHLPDITAIRPVFVDGKLAFMTVNRAHHTDVGGGTHGGYNPSASEIFHEGLRIPPLRIYDNDKPRDDLLQMMAANVRYPKNFLGDLNAQIGSILTAERRIRELVQHYGAERLSGIVDGILDATEAQVRSFISDWPDGEYFGESLVDDDGFDSELIPIRARITIAGDTMTIDLSESAAAGYGLHQQRLRQHAVIGARGDNVPCALRCSQERRLYGPLEGHRARRLDSQRELARARVHEHQPLRRRDSGGDIQGAGAGGAGVGERRFLPAAAIRHHGRRPKNGRVVPVALLHGERRRRRGAWA